MTDEEASTQEPDPSTAEPDETDEAVPEDDAGDETVESEDTPEETTEDGLSDGDFVTLDYTMRTVEDGTLVDTTDEEIAEEEGIDTEERDFGPRTIVIGAGHVFGTVESALQGQSVGDTGSVEVSPTEAFGEYEPDQVQTVSADKIPDDDRYPGARVTIDGEQGHVETIIGGRARVDFNHPLAGETIEYEYEITDVVEERDERAEALLSAYLDMDLEVSFGTETEERTIDTDDEEADPETEEVDLETLYIEATPQLSMNQQWLFSKQQIASELTERIGVDQVVVREVLGGGAGLGGMMGGGLGGLEDADLDDVDTDEIVEELEADMDIEE